MKSILTVIGKDQVGIIAGVSNELSKFNINILNFQVKLPIPTTIRFQQL